MSKLRGRIKYTEEERRKRREEFQRVLNDEEYGEELMAIAREHLVSHSPEYYIEEYRRTGKYSNIDHPGGMQGFIKDYEAGLLDE